MYGFLCICTVLLYGLDSVRLLQEKMIHERAMARIPHLVSLFGQQIFHVFNRMPFLQHISIVVFRCFVRVLTQCRH